MKIKIGTIPATDFTTYRLDVMFDGYKWDLQAGEQSTISDKVALFEPSEADVLIHSAVGLYHETILAERALQERPDLVQRMGISKAMTDALCCCDYDPSGHVRFMRFDFHPTTDGWQISEVNSDVPAGYPEASIHSQLAQKYFDEYVPVGNFSDVLTRQLSKLVPAGKTIAYVHDTHTVEDYQILHFIGDLMEKKGYHSLYADPSHIDWKDHHATDVGAVMRYYPVEWLEFAKNVDWHGFVNAKTPSCNHPMALLTQSKRLPIVWDELDVALPLWKQLLPETKCARFLDKEKGWILKPAFGRVGEGINVPGTLSRTEEMAIKAAAFENPEQWVAQKVFQSVPVDGLHLNIGVFVVDGEFAGMYARASTKPRIDGDASEIPVLMSR